MISLKEIEKREIEVFWGEVERVCQKRPPKQVQRKLVGKEFRPGERSALAWFWAGLEEYGQGLERARSEEDDCVLFYGQWLQPFKKAAKAKRRLGQEKKTTSHNLALFKEAWDLIDQLSENEVNYLDTDLNVEMDFKPWMANLCFLMAINQMRNVKFYYEKGLWTLGLEEEDNPIRTKAKGLEYDRLLFRSSIIIYDTPVTLKHLLPDSPEGWMFPGREQGGLLALANALSDQVDRFDYFYWPDEPFIVPLDNGCELLVEKAYFHPRSSEQDIGFVYVTTPSGVFQEAFNLDNDQRLWCEFVSGWPLGSSSFLAHFGKRDEHGPMVEFLRYLRQRIACKVCEAAANPPIRKKIPPVPFADQNIVWKEKPKSKVLIPKGNLLYGDL